MSITSAMYTGISGLNANGEAWLDVLVGELEGIVDQVVEELHESGAIATERPGSARDLHPRVALGDRAGHQFQRRAHHLLQRALLRGARQAPRP